MIWSRTVQILMLSVFVQLMMVWKLSEYFFTWDIMEIQLVKMLFFERI